MRWGGRNLSGTCSIQHNCSFSHWLFFFISFGCHYITINTPSSSIFNAATNCFLPLLTHCTCQRGPVCQSLIRGDVPGCQQQQKRGGLSKASQRSCQGLKSKFIPFNTHHLVHIQVGAKFTETKDSVSSLLSQHHFDVWHRHASCAPLCLLHDHGKTTTKNCHPCILGVTFFFTYTVYTSKQEQIKRN